jgi:hypothetical protein
MRKLAIVLVSLVIMAFVIGIAGCGAGGTPTTTPTPTPAPTPTPLQTPSVTLTAEWSPDGIISAREYSKAETYGNYEIHWRSDDQYIYVGMKAKTSGFVAVGFQPGSRMKNADMVFGFVKDGEVAIYDMFSTGDFGPHSPDTQLGGTNDITHFGGKEEGGYTTIEFKRALATGDDYDNPISSGKDRIIWAYGSSDSLTLRHSNRGYGEIDL